MLLSDLNADSEERVRYIPQNYLETICNELQSAQGSQFRIQLEQVVMSHVLPRDRAGHETIDALIRYRTAELEVSLTQKRDSLNELNKEIADTEKRTQSKYREQLQRQLEQKRTEISVLEAARPNEVPKPADDPNVDPELKAKAEAAETAKGELEDLAHRLEENQRAQVAETQANVSAGKLLVAVANFKQSFMDLQEAWKEEATNVGVRLEDVVTLSVNPDPLTRRMVAAKEALTQLENEADPDIEGSLGSQRSAKAEELAGMRKELSAPQQAYDAYLEQLAAWEQKKKELTGDSETPGTLEHLIGALERLQELPNELERQRRERGLLVREIFALLEAVKEVYEELYRPVQSYIADHPLASKKMKLEFGASITEQGLAADFFQLVRQDRSGTYCRGGEAVLADFVRNADFTTADGVVAFAEEVAESLHQDKRNEACELVDIDDQLREGKTRVDVYDLLFSMNYLAPAYSLKWAGKELDQLSPGEKGALLLVFYLLIDKDKKPLVIDQPEENLDNESVYDILVPCIREARERRQVIMVTHNPNLAVVCDADQVIRASLDVEAGCRLTYSTGALENPAINRDTVDVLEGTQPAFKKRDHKYSAAQPDWLTEPG